MLRYPSPDLETYSAHWQILKVLGFKKKKKKSVSFTEAKVSPIYLNPRLRAAPFQRCCNQDLRGRKISRIKLLWATLKCRLFS